MNKINIKLYFHSKEKRKLVSINNLLNPLQKIDTTSNCSYVAHTNNYYYKGVKYYSECYYFLYTDNDAIGCFNLFPYNKSLGYHKYDCEKVIILFDYNKYINNIYEPIYVYFAQHSSKQGQWKKWEDCNKDNSLEKKTLYIYVARGSHASYPKPKTTFRIFCFGNDTCSYNEKYSVLVNNYYNAMDLTTPIRMSSLVNYVPEKEMNLLQKFIIPLSLK
jgi:hypothetical protein